MATNTPVAQLYRVASSYFRGPQWTPDALIAKRTRTLIRVLALESRAIELDVGAIPVRTMEAIRQLTGFKEARVLLGRQQRVAGNMLLEEPRGTWEFPQRNCPKCGGGQARVLELIGGLTTLVLQCSNTECKHVFHIGPS